MKIEKRVLGSNGDFLALAQERFNVYKNDNRLFLYENNTEYVFFINDLIQQGLIKEINSLNNIVEYETQYKN